MLKILNASPGFGTPLNKQVNDFLSNKVLNVHLGTVDENGHAIIHPAWYYYNPLNNKIYVETGKSPRKQTI